MQSLHVGTYARIPVKIHWSFGLLIIYIAYITQSEGLNTPQTIGFSAYIAIIFLCVILHEYGHALAARRYGVKTLDIIISPIGGLARLERLPKKAFHEFVVAIAGPLVNVGIVALLLIFSHFYWGLDVMINHSLELTDLVTPISFVYATIVLNTILFLFNLIPAFPMDGGRILRALLAVKLGRLKATRIASFIGQVLAACFIGAAIYFGIFMWGLIGLFIIQMARTEYNSVKSEAILEGKVASDIMRREFSKVHIGSTLDDIKESILLTNEKNILVENSMGHIHGVIDESVLANAIKSNQDILAGQLSSANYAEIPGSTGLREVFNIINNKGLSMVIIKEDDQLLGIIDRPLFKSYIISASKA